MGIHFKENEEKITIGRIISGVVIIAILVTSLIVYLLNINNSLSQEEIASGEEIKTSEETNNKDDFEAVSIDIGKSVNEVKNETAEAEIKKQELPKHKVTEEPEKNKEENVVEEPKTESNLTVKNATDSDNKDDSIWGLAIFYVSLFLVFFLIFMRGCS